MRKRAWIIVLFMISFLYILSSIPGLKVLPVLRYVNSVLLGFDLSVVRLSEWIASKLPLDFSELHRIDTLTRDFLIYAREHPLIIEFFLRKMAHITIFFVITIALFYLLHQYIRSSALTVLISFIGGGGLAYLDEYRQTFVDGRVGSSVDVFIDMLGVSLAICLIAFSLFITRSGHKKLSEKEPPNKKDCPKTAE